MVRRYSKKKGPVRSKKVKHDGIQFASGLEKHMYIALKKAKIKASTRVIYLATSNKLNMRLNYNVCNLKDIDTLVTELDPLAGSLKEYLKAGVNLL